MDSSLLKEAIAPYMSSLKRYSVNDLVNVQDRTKDVKAAPVILTKNIKTDDILGYCDVHDIDLNIYSYCISIPATEDMFDTTTLEWNLLFNGQTIDYWNDDRVKLDFTQLKDRVAKSLVINEITNRSQQVQPGSKLLIHPPYGELLDPTGQVLFNDVVDIPGDADEEMLEQLKKDHISVDKYFYYYDHTRKIPLIQYGNKDKEDFDKGESPLSAEQLEIIQKWVQRYPNTVRYGYNPDDIGEYDDDTSDAMAEYQEDEKFIRKNDRRRYLPWRFAIIGSYLYIFSANPFTPERDIKSLLVLKPALPNMDLSSFDQVRDLGASIIGYEGHPLVLPYIQVTDENIAEFNIVGLKENDIIFTSNTTSARIYLTLGKRWFRISKDKKGHNNLLDIVKLKVNKLWGELDTLDPNNKDHIRRIYKIKKLKRHFLLDDELNTQAIISLLRHMKVEALITTNRDVSVLDDVVIDCFNLDRIKLRDDTFYVIYSGKTIEEWLEYALDWYALNDEDEFTHNAESYMIFSKLTKGKLNHKLPDLESAIDIPEDYNFRTGVENAQYLLNKDLDLFMTYMQLEKPINFRFTMKSAKIDNKVDTYDEPLPVQHLFFNADNSYFKFNVKNPNRNPFDLYICGLLYDGHMIVERHYLYDTINIPVTTLHRWIKKNIVYKDEINLNSINLDKLNEYRRKYDLPDSDDYKALFEYQRLILPTENLINEATTIEDKRFSDKVIFYSDLTGDARPRYKSDTTLRDLKDLYNIKDKEIYNPNPTEEPVDDGDDTDNGEVDNPTENPVDAPETTPETPDDTTHEREIGFYNLRRDLVRNSIIVSSDIEIRKGMVNDESRPLPRYTIIHPEIEGASTKRDVHTKYKVFRNTIADKIKELNIKFLDNVKYPGLAHIPVRLSAYEFNQLKELTKFIGILYGTRYGIDHSTDNTILYVIVDRDDNDLWEYERFYIHKIDITEIYEKEEGGEE